MASKFALTTVLVAALSFANLGCEASAPNSEAPVSHDTRPDPPKELAQRKPKTSLHTLSGYTGHVTDLGPDWVELGVGWSSIESEREKWIVQNKKPKRISTAGSKPGGDADGVGETTSHRLADLKVGDQVRFQTGITRGGEEFCLEICIQRRPNGKIPPMFGDVFKGTQYARHLSYQAEQDWEEKGIPIPKQFLNPQGRVPWTNPPYPLPPPLAPAPREVKTRNPSEKP